MPDITPERHRQLVAAATALTRWVHEQRAGWPASGVVAPARRVAVQPPALSLPHADAAGRSPGPGLDDGPAAPDEVTIPLPAGFGTLEAARTPELGPQASSWAEDRDRDNDDAPGVLQRPFVRWALAASLAVAAATAVAYPAYRKWSARPVVIAPPAPRLGTVILASFPPGSEVFIDGNPAGRAPVTKDLPPGVHHVEFRRLNSSRKLSIEIVAGESTAEALDWTARRNGSLEVLSEPPGAVVIVDGVGRGVTPLTIDDLDAGNHAVVLETEAGAISRTVTITPDAPAQIAESIRSGWLHVDSRIELEVVRGGQRTPLDERNEIRLPPGTHDLVFENQALGVRERRKVGVKLGTVTSISVAPAPSLLTLRATLPAEVFIDEASVGQTPLVNHPISVGRREVVIKSVSGVERRFALTVTSKPIALEVDFSRP